MASTGGKGSASRGEGGGGVEVLKGLELYVHHSEVCSSWEGEGKRASALEVEGVEARWALKEARL